MHYFSKNIFLFKLKEMKGFWKNYGNMFVPKTKIFLNCILFSEVVIRFELRLGRNTRT
jgi:hypothetical protein